jgi:DNA repair protein RadC
MHEYHIPRRAMRNNDDRLFQVSYNGTLIPIGSDNYLLQDDSLYNESELIGLVDAFQFAIREILDDQSYQLPPANRLGVIHAVRHADLQDLGHILGITDSNQVNRITAAVSFANQFFRTSEKGRVVIRSFAELAQHLQSRRATLTEMALVLCFNHRNEVIHELELGQGTGSDIVVSLRTIVKTAIEQGASALVLAHTHPSGSARPSQADTEVTTLLQKALEPLQIPLLDHVIITPQGSASILTEDHIPSTSRGL